MSDDSTPPPLRLKPRLKAEGDAGSGAEAQKSRDPSAEKQQAPAQEDVAQENETGLKQGGSEKDHKEPSASPGPDSGQRAPLDRRTEEKLRLRFPPSSGPGETSGELSAPNIPQPKGTPPLFIPAVSEENTAEGPAARQEPQPLPVPVDKSSNEPPVIAPRPRVPPAQSRSFKVGLGLSLAILALILAGAGFAAWNWLSGVSAPSSAVIPPSQKTGPEKREPAKDAPPKPEQPAVAPVARARQVVEERRNGETVKAADLATAPSPPQPSAQAAPSPARDQEVKKEPVSPAQTPGAPSDAFKRYVAGLKIRGVFQGSPARILIDRQTVQQGEWADRQLGIRFESIDAARKTVTFREVSTDTTLTRKY